MIGASERHANGRFLRILPEGYWNQVPISALEMTKRYSQKASERIKMKSTETTMRRKVFAVMEEGGEAKAASLPLQSKTMSG